MRLSLVVYTILIMRILSSNLLPDIDRATCQAQNIDSIQLMERAASFLSCEVMQRYTTSQRIVVFAGPGNNGGDALATARNLIEQGYKRVEVFLFNIENRLSHDCEAERRKLITIDGVDFTEINTVFNPPDLSKEDVVIDGLFGAGLNKPLQGGFIAVARLINESGAFVISIDTPSGLFGEWNSNVNLRDVVNADLTFTFGWPSLSFFFEENARATGHWEVLDINLDKSAIRHAETNFFRVEPESIRPLLHKRDPFSGKRDFGSAMIFAGSMGMMGAAVMCAQATLRTGAGIATVHSANCGLNVLQTTVPEAIFEPDRADRFISDMTLHHEHQVVIAGPGIGTSEATVNALESLLKNVHSPLVLDADALNCIASRPSLLNLIPPQTVITPHAGEFDRLFGEHTQSEDRLKKAIEVAQYYNLIIVLKGHYTANVRPTGKVYFNSTGNSGMATAGSGDVLAGIIGGLIAQGYRPELAATIGVYVHGLAGDMAAQAIGEYGMLATDIISHIGPALAKLSRE